MALVVLSLTEETNFPTPRFWVLCNDRDRETRQCSCLTLRTPRLVGRVAYFNSANQIGLLSISRMLEK